LELYPGDFRRPLVVKVYYVVDLEDQGRIVDAVSSVLRDQELNQARIDFWEAEVVLPSSPPGHPEIRGWRRGPESLLRSVNVNC
jgi:hypothetical protein